jgi:hypothetical protein
MKASQDIILLAVHAALVGSLIISGERCLAQSPAASSTTEVNTPVQTTGTVATAEPDARFADLVRLIKSGADTNVLVAYIAASSVPYQLTADQAAYLRDLGVPSDALVKMGAPAPAADEAEPAMPTAEAVTPQAAEAYTAPAAEPSAVVAPTEPPAEPPAEAPTEYGPAPEATPEVEQVAVTPEDVVVPPPDQVDVSFFYEALSPYGRWFEMDGVWCWQPTTILLDDGWQPYCQGGHWIYTDCGWAWYSDYAWGWAPFHYGRWRHHRRYGWIWAPDTVWGPAWVCWREQAEGIGWAPLPPEAVYEPSIGLVYDGRSVAVGFGFGLGIADFTFVAPQHFCEGSLERHRLPRDRASRIYARSTIIENNYTYIHNTIINQGPSVTHLAQVTHRDIRPVKIVDQDLPAGATMRRNRISSDGLLVYRPHVAARAPQTPRAVITRLQADAAKHAEARRDSAFRMDGPAAAVSSESQRGKISRAVPRPGVASGSRPVITPNPTPRPEQPVVRQPGTPSRVEAAEAARRKAEAEAASRLRAEQEAAARVHQAEAAARSQAQQEAVARQRAQQEVQARQQEAQRRAQEVENARVQAQQAAAARLRAQAEAEARQQREQEAARLRAQAEAADRQRQDAATRWQAQQEAVARERAQQEAQIRQQGAERRAQEAEATARQQAQAEAAARVRAQAQAVARQQESAFQAEGNRAAAAAASQRGATSRERHH